MIDLHTHSRASDGTDQPAQVLEAAAAAGVRVVALTDHDTTAGWAQAAAAVPRTGVALVRGTEISTRASTPAGGMSVHLLSYLHDPDDVVLRAACDRTRDDRLSRARRMAELLGEDFPVTWDDVVAQTGDDATVGRPHLADALVVAGVVATRDEAFATMLHPGARYYVPHYAPATADTVRAVLAAGGVPVVAHPGAGGRGRTLTDDDVAALAAAGLVGLEVDHRDHDAAARDRLRGLAHELDLLVTGSSDYHGTGKLNRIGEHTTSPEVLAQIEERGTLDVVRP
ncbi:PHP domain-containing protein [Isoptericola sp. NEAU-Y5]|uniref:PHP domain-containing protein n=1 Tax=Isoptericola luteus TaxID=2879484 RepID=A0ABS7ZBQ9_9MICO|nr:PHP domain-containing protein [Isoptericola sp. NEAU-Y5]MCA5892486.1 PHP domain-containing protein [Isoptericola sp. NEAU-Y5]